MIQDYSQTALPDSPEGLEAKQELYSSENFDDELTQKIGDAREEGEKCLLSFLHRTSIRGEPIIPEPARNPRRLVNSAAIGVRFDLL